MASVLTLARNINRLIVTVARARNIDGAGDIVIFVTQVDFPAMLIFDVQVIRVRERVG